MKIKSIKTNLEKAKILKECSDSGKHLSCYYDEEPETNIKNIRKMSDNKYLIIPPYQYDQLENWLSLGNWQIIHPDQSEYKFINTFKLSEDEIKNHIDNNQIELLIDSFHDNIEWNVIINL